MHNEQEQSSTGGFDVAIVGWAGRFPGAGDVAQFWENLREGVSSVRTFSEEELLQAGVSPAKLADRRFVRAGAVLDGEDQFDASFFEINRQEAELLDPQHRIFMECAWEALEEAGYDPERYAGDIGLFGGVSFHPYLWQNLWGTSTDPLDGHLLKINLGGALTTRVSYKLNLRGPSVTVQSGCSTSLVAVHLACQSLLCYESDMALAGGVSITPGIRGYIAQDGALSPDGRVCAFDADARGVVGGDGAAVVVLKRLGDAVADGDHIYGVIKGSAVNNDGSFKIGYAAPSVQGQTRAILAAQAVAGVRPETISYVEAHGTATPLGDTIELKALTEAFKAGTRARQFCAVGSVKTNVGHLDNAAGVAGLIKTALSLHHGLLPPSLNFQNPNPEINFADSPFYVNTTLREWKRGETPRRAAVSSFGIGGTNAHAILEEAPAPEPPSSSRPWQLIPLSAKTATALEAVTGRLADYLRQHPEADLADVAYTCQVGRKVFGHRRALVCRDVQDALEALDAPTTARVQTAACGAAERPLVFMFPGGGAQYLEMGRGLYQDEPVFREQFDRCSQLLRPHLGFDMSRVLYSPRGTDADAAALFADPACAMPAVFAVEYSLAQLLFSWGLRPQAMIGHSFGEYVAAALAGVFTLEDVLELISLRGRLFEQLEEGAMLSVPLDEQEIEPLLGDRLSLAAVNGAARCVVSGPVEAVAALEASLAARRVKATRLTANRAGHSSMVTPILKPFSEFVSRLNLKAPEVPFISNVTGTWITPAQATDPDYWVRHLRQTVRFGDGVKELVSEPSRILVEVGPGQSLSSLARREFADKRTQLTLPTLRDPGDKRGDTEFLLGSLGKLWLAGASVDWDGFYRNERRRRLSLPTYPFERQSYRREAGRAKPSAAATPARATVADEGWCHSLGWKRAQRAGRGTTGARREAAHTSPCVIFTDADGLGERLASRLRDGQRPVITVSVGEAFRREGDAAYTVEPCSADDYRALLADVTDRHGRPSDLVYLWSVGPTSGAEHHAAVLSLVSAAAALDWTEPARLHLVTAGAQEVTGEESLDAGQATLLAWCSTTAASPRVLDCRSIDLQQLPAGDFDREKAAEQLFAEVSTDGPDRFVAYRGAYRWVQTTETVGDGPAPEENGGLRRGGVYMIVNGTEGVGLRLAEFLAREAAARLILTRPAGSRVGAGAARAGRLEVALRGETERINGWEKEATEKLFVRTLRSYPGLEEEFNALCANYIVRFFDSGGVRVRKGSAVTREELAKSLRLSGPFDHFLELFLEELSNDGVIRLGEGGVEFLKDGSEIIDPEELRQQLSQRFPDFAPSFWLLDHCVKSYPAVFAGEVTANSVLYPDGSYDMLQRLGREAGQTYLGAAYRSLLSQVVGDLASRSTRPLRILEVGGGTGVLTEQILNAVGDRSVEYHFTDIGRAFVVKAERQAPWAKSRRVRFGLLDISKDPAAQGFEREAYDVIVALDVVQATSDVAASLRHMRGLLAPSGALFLLQTLKAFRWQHLTFGLSPGWWNFKDDPLRRNSPVLSLSRWEETLREHDFESVQSFPRAEAEPDAEFGMLVAQRSAAPAEPARDGHGDVEALRALGAEVFVAEVDAPAGGGMLRAAEAASGQFGQPVGVFYVAPPEEISSDDETRFETAVASIGAGLAAEHELSELGQFVAGRELELCLLLSSLTARPGTPAHLLEEARQQLLETYAARHNRESETDAWSCVGLDLRRSQAGAQPSAQLTEEEAARVFRRVLANESVSRLRVSAEKMAAAAEPAGQSGEPLTVAPQSSDEGGPRGHVEAVIDEVWRELLGLDTVGRHENFFDLGGDSLIALQLISRLRDRLRVELTVADLFEHQTVAEQAVYIEGLSADATPAAEADAAPAREERGEDNLDDLLTRLEHLSDEQIRALLD